MAIPSLAFDHAKQNEFIEKIYQVCRDYGCGDFILLTSVQDSFDLVMLDRGSIENAPLYAIRELLLYATGEASKEVILGTNYQKDQNDTENN